MATFLSFIASPLKAAYHAVLSKLLAPYVEDFNRSDFDISLVSGKARFSNLKLRRDIFADLQLPIAVREGVVESLTLSVPWTASLVYRLYYGEDVSSISMDPIELVVDTVRVNIAPLESMEFEYDAAAALEEALLQKLSQADAAMRSRLTTRRERWGVPSPPREESALVERIVGVLMRFLTISVHHVHVAYVDRTSDGTRPFQLGLVLDRLMYGPCTDVCCSAEAQAGELLASPDATEAAAAAASAGDTTRAGRRSLAGGGGGSTGAPAQQQASHGTFKAGSDPSLPPAASSALRFEHHTLQWDGLMVYLNSLREHDTAAGSGGAAGAAAAAATAAALSRESEEAATGVHVRENPSRTAASSARPGRRRRRRSSSVSSGGSSTRSNVSGGSGARAHTHTHSRAGAELIARGGGRGGEGGALGARGRSPSLLSAPTASPSSAGPASAARHTHARLSAHAAAKLA